MVAAWASCQIHKNVDCACAGKTGNIFPATNLKETAGKQSRHASRHVRDASAVMHVRITNPSWRGKRSRHSRRMHNPQFYVSDKRPLASSAHVTTLYLGKFCCKFKDLPWQHLFICHWFSFVMIDWRLIPRFRSSWLHQRLAKCITAPASPLAVVSFPICWWSHKDPSLGINSYIRARIKVDPCQ